MNETQASESWSAIVAREWKTQANLSAMCRRFNSFGLAPFSSAEEIEYGLSEVSRAVALIAASQRWSEPHIGPAEYPTETDRYRGKQWRLTLAHAGWESFARGISRGDKKAYECWTAVAHVPTSSLAAPDPSKQAMLRRWLDGRAHMEIETYFGLLPAAWQHVREWLVEGKPATEHGDMMGLAAALRHATAHGMLSASKANDWGLIPAFEALTEYLSQTVGFGVDQLVSA